jgi:hypothetical protein
MLDALAAEFSRPALFDEGVEAARNACVAGAPLSAAAITAAAYYGNPLTGAPALLACMQRLEASGLSLAAWTQAFALAVHPTTGDPAFSPGFGFVLPEQHGALGRACDALLQQVPGERLAFFAAHREVLEIALGPLNHAGLTALVFSDHGLTAEDAERAYLLLRLEPALGEAQKTRAAGLRAFPFFEKGYVYEGDWPRARSASESAALDLNSLAKEVGLEF